jgi:uncharacterized protein (UPF0332 family)
LKEIEALLQRADKYLKSSTLLLKAEDFESSISRSYYAMYFAAQAMLLKKGLSFSSHKGVISAFGEHFIKTGIFSKDMGKELNRAFTKRQISDYEFTFVLTKEEAEKILENAKFFVKKITVYLKNPR